MFSIQENPFDNKSCCSFIKGDQCAEEFAHMETALSDMYSKFGSMADASIISQLWKYYRFQQHFSFFQSILAQLLCTVWAIASLEQAEDHAVIYLTFHTIRLPHILIPC
jgi:hypothetical protein